MATRRGDTLIFPKPPVIAAHACIGGKKEGESPLAAEFDELHSDNRLGQASWEAAETQLQLQTARLCLKKAHATEKDVSLLLAGDLQAQCTASGYAARALGLPFAGLFGACSTMAEALGVGACLCSAGMADGLLAMTSSHFCTAERQFRTPLSYGAVRTPTAQWGGCWSTGPCPRAGAADPFPGAAHRAGPPTWGRPRHPAGHCPQQGTCPAHAGAAGRRTCQWLRRPWQHRYSGRCGRTFQPPYQAPGWSVSRSRGWSSRPR